MTGPSASVTGPFASGPAPRPVVAGYDGSPESLAATAWAAREAARRGLSLELLRAWPWPKHDVLGSDETYRRALAQLADREAELHALLPDLPVTSSALSAGPAEALEAAAQGAALLVLGSRGLGPVLGTLVGSVSQEVLRRVTCPVVLVRPAEHAEAEHADAEHADAEHADAEHGAAEHAAGGPQAGGPQAGGAVTVGLDLAHPAAEVLAFAFESAALRSAPLRIVHVWAPPAGTEYMSYGAIGGQEADISSVQRDALAEVVAPWRARHPGVDVTTDLVRGKPAVELVDAAATARLLVVGRRTRHLPFLHHHLGPVARAAIHHVHGPVAVVPHG